jgi:Holliday junction resolvasome RuvABC endonuclease subunit
VLKQPKHRLFIDPASISTGWALFSDDELIRSGTVATNKKDDVFDRLNYIFNEYKKLKFTNVDEVHIEQLVRNTHIYTHWSVSVIAMALYNPDRVIAADISISAWQKATSWKTTKDPIKAYKGRVSSEDELAAIGMGTYYTRRFSGLGKKARRKK